MHQRMRIVVENMDPNMFLDNDFITRNCLSNMIWLKKQGVKSVCLVFGIHLTWFNQEDMQVCHELSN